MHKGHYLLPDLLFVSLFELAVLRLELEPEDCAGFLSGAFDRLTDL
jgi:hypothetical protein